jgi:hypothetical protein
MNKSTKPTMASTLIKYGVQLSESTRQRIKMLGEMNVRYKRALGNRQQKALRVLADEYAAIGCPRLANEIRTQARELRKKRVVDPARMVSRTQEIRREQLQTV